jgi:outer membrane protein assembly factor BamB
MTRPLRLWPAIAIVVLFVLTATVGKALMPGEPLMMLGGVVCALLLLLWWAFFSRARWFERVGAILLIPVVVLLAGLGLDPSIAGGAQGFLGYIFGIEFALLAIAVWAVATSRLSDRTRRWALVPMVIVVGVLPLLSIRTEGVYGGEFVLHWRWTPTPEELLLAHANDEPKPLPPVVVETPKEIVPAPAPAVQAPAPAVTPEPDKKEVVAPAGVAIPAEWPGFRGPNRDSVVRNVQIKTDWAQSPPVQIWRRAVGPGWSSFSVRGDLFYTQEQRGDDEVVSAHRGSTGEPARPAC